LPVGNVTPCFFRQARTFGSRAAARKPPRPAPFGVVVEDDEVAPALDFELPPHAERPRAATASRVGTTI
jgi:hypothetical protein